MKKRGQAAIFVVVAIVIVSVFLLIIVYPRVQVFISDVNPGQFIRSCLEPEIERVLPKITSQGGSYQPEHYVTHLGKKIQYLCYTAENYKPCIVQQPLLVRHVEREIKEQIQPRARQCVQQLKEEYERRGYRVSIALGDINVSIVQGSIETEYTGLFEVSKENTQTFRTFGVSKTSELYDLLMLSTSIIEFESTLGGSETLLYVQFYPDLKIEKLKKEGDTIYTLTNVVTEDKFTFATRSLAWPSGYGFIQST